MGDPGSIPWSGRSPGEGNGNLLQSSCRTEEPGGLQSIESLSHTWLSNFTSRWGPIRVVSESRSVVSDSLQTHGLQHTRPPCPSWTPRVYSNSCPLSPWYHPTISSSVISFSSCLQSVPASGFFQMSQFFASGGQSVGVSSSTSVLPMNIQDWFPLGWTGWISLLSKGLLSLLQHHRSKASVLRCSAFFIVQLSHPYMTTGKTIAMTGWTFAEKVMSLLLNMLSRLVISFQGASIF